MQLHKLLRHLYLNLFIQKPLWTYILEMEEQENGFVALCFAGRRGPYVNNFVYTTRRSPGAACTAGRFSIVAVPIVAVPIFGLLSVTVLGRVGGAPCQRRGRPRASAGACARWAIRGARKPPLRLGSPAKDAPGPRRATTRVRFQGIRSNLIAEFSCRHDCG